MVSTIGRMKKRRALTLLEIMIAMVLLGVLLTGLFNAFRQAVKKNITTKELKQRILPLELFQQRIKVIFSHLYGESKLWLQPHPDSAGMALMVAHEQEADPEFDMCGPIQSMLYLTSAKELCLVNWSTQGRGRVETLMNKVEGFSCRLFDGEEWVDAWPKNRKERPVMVEIKLKREKQDTPFVFFLSDPEEKIVYRAQEGFVNLDSARQSKIEAPAFRTTSPAPSGQGEEEDRFGKVAASPNLPNLTERGIYKGPM